ncbi:hypothetical protein BN946_scf184909.g44 [Trametes cinnabarina]|uniref:Uncharacterized protein n=1 Tax=Pycnoporus cinnabarinus TaxID=5643 RepID=A0A060SAR8_PYCCI|nr:hypothetical protein BN946_scf184909.g44 [Trametes cinnabarina]
MYPPFSPQQLESSASSGPAHRADSAHPPHLSYSHMAPHPAHIMAWMSYFMASGALPLPHALPPSAPGFPPSVPTPFYGHPSTPTHGQPRQNSHNRDPNPPSSEAGPSRSAYSTPAHQAYPPWFNPGYSGGTLPPSSPFPSSPIDSSPALRPASVPSGQRSKARGRRVSFKLQTHVRPLSSTPPPDADERGSNVRVGQSDDNHVSDDERARGRSRSRGRRECTPKIPTSGKGKGKARAICPSDASDDGDKDADRQDSAGRAGPDHGRPPPRARTPGPPSRREQSVPRGSSRSNEKTSTKKT